MDAVINKCVHLIKINVHMCTEIFEEYYEVQVEVKNQTTEVKNQKNQMAQKWDMSAESSPFHCHSFVSPVAAAQLQSVVLMHL